MDDGPILLLTRPEAQARSFLSDCEMHLGRKVHAVISPLMKIVPFGDLPDLDPYASIVVSSSNAVRRMGNDLAGRRVFTVGAATAGLARSFGAVAAPLGETAEELIRRAEEIASPALVCRGVHVRLDLCQALGSAGVTCDEAVVYDQVAVPLQEEAESVLVGALPVVAPIFSPRSAELLAEASIAAPMTIVAMSDAVAKAWTGPGAIVTADAPNIAAMIKATAEAL